MPCPSEPKTAAPLAAVVRGWLRRFGLVLPPAPIDLTAWKKDPRHIYVDLSNPPKGGNEWMAFFLNLALVATPKLFEWLKWAVLLAAVQAVSHAAHDWEITLLAVVSNIFFTGYMLAYSTRFYIMSGSHRRSRWISLIVGISIMLLFQSAAWYAGVALSPAKPAPASSASTPAAPTSSPPATSDSGKVAGATDAADKKPAGESPSSLNDANWWTLIFSVVGGIILLLMGYFGRWLQEKILRQPRRGNPGGNETMSGMQSVKQEHRPSRTKLLASAAIAALVFAFLAWWLDHDGHFWFHLCLEIAVALGIIVITVTIVEKLVERQRREELKAEWSRVRSATIETLCMGLVQIAGYIFLFLYAKKEQKQRDESAAIIRVLGKTLLQPTNETIEAVGRMSELLAAGGGVVEVDERLCTRIILLWRRQIKPRLDTIRMTVIPRLLNAEADRPLLEELMQLDKRAFLLESQVSVNRMVREVKKDEKDDLENWKPVVDEMVTLVGRCSDVVARAIAPAG